MGGQVVLPSGKMSTRTGTVVLFTELRQRLYDLINQEFLDAKKGEWSDEEIAHARHAIAVGTIKYGMLNHDVVKNIVFDMNKWASKQSGNTGPYLMYQYTRVAAINRKAQVPEGTPVNWSLLDDQECNICYNLSDFQNTVERTAKEYNPSTLCTYLFQLANEFSSWYAKDD